MNRIIIIIILIALAFFVGKYGKAEPVVKLVPYRPSETYRVTAYCPCEKCCGRFADGITASGHKIQTGDKFIAAPKEIPFHTWINVPGYGMAEVLDRGGAIKGKRLDVFFPNHQQALDWGVKYLEIDE